MLNLKLAERISNILVVKIRFLAEKSFVILKKYRHIGVQ